jgi:hypothetical protein
MLPGGVRLGAQNMAAAEVSGSIWPAHGDYVGAKKCALCHPKQAASYRSSSMHRALEPIDNCEILKNNPRMEWSDGTYQYRIEQKGRAYAYHVSDGRETAEANLMYSFGQGKAGQTYVFQVNGDYFESRVSYYQRFKGLALTVGAQNLTPTSLQQAMGRDMGPTEARDCFGCHTTAARRGSTLQLEHYESGVQCEACHGPGGAHIASISDGKPKPGTIRDLKGMSAEETNDFCGSCHRTWETITLMKIRGVNNIRFQPYRLTNSQCFLSGDKRIACTACHDPHSGLVKGDQAYDSKCTACHGAQNTSIRKRTCKTGTSACTSCHMPRYELPGGNHAFADHWIRIARKGDGYPD